MGDQADVRPQCPLSVSDDSVPEPDFAVVPIVRQRQAHPHTAHLVVEIADISLPKDRGLKAKLYAEVEVTEYWVVNLVDDVVEVYAGPEGSTYRTATTKSRDDAITLVAFPDVTIAVDNIL